MGRRHSIKDINLQIDSIDFFHNDTHQGMFIRWISTIGFGEYTIYIENETGQIYGDSECMDSNEDKEFITELLKLVNMYILSQIEIAG